MAPSASPQLSIYCLGAFAVHDRQGRKLPLQTQKSKALLALLALAPRGSRSRVWLRDKLWSDRDPEQAAGSLRQALLEIRKALGPDNAAVLVADKQTVTLDLSSVSVDILDYRRDPGRLRRLSASPETGTLELLEGIDIADPEFEEWLTVERSNWADALEAARGLGPEDAASADRSGIPDDGPDGKSPRVGDPVQPGRSTRTGTAEAPPDGSAPPFAEGVTPEILPPRSITDPTPEVAPPRAGLGLLPNICEGVDTVGASVADLIAEAITRSVCEFQPIDVFDYRDAAFENFGLGTGEGPEWMIRIRIIQLGTARGLTLLVYRASSMKLVWSNSIQADQDEVLQLDSTVLSSFIAQCVDRLALALFNQAPSSGSRASARARASYAALNLIFRDSVADMEAAERLLTERNEDDPQAVYMGLLTYISSFRIGEGLGEFDDHRREVTRIFARQTLETDPFNSLALACVGHVEGYVMRDFETAGELLTRAITLNPHQAFAWDHYALFNLYVGRLDEALRASRNAVLLGSYSPLRYSFETTLCMVSTLLGDHATAIHYGRRSLNRQPRFRATKRYLIAAHGLAGQREDSEALIKDLLASDPSFSLDSIRGNTMAVIDPDGRDRLIEGFRSAGLT